MNASEKLILKGLIEKYNTILKESMASALSEDLFNLIIVNGDDKNFKLVELLDDKQKLKDFVLKEFIRINNQPITSDLKQMEEVKLNIVKTKQTKLGI